MYRAESICRPGPARVLVTMLAMFSLALVLAGCSGTGVDSEPFGTPDFSIDGSSDFSVDGTWTGERELIHPSEGYRQGTAEMEVLETQGRTFVAEMTYPTPEGDITEKFVGAMTPDATVMSGSNPGGNYSFSVVDENTLDYCYTQTGEENYLTVCGRLTRDG